MYRACGERVVFGMTVQTVIRGAESLIPAGYGIQFAENEWDRYAGRGMDGMRDY